MMLLALALVLSLAQEPTVVTGIVRDSTGGVVPGASVILRPASGGEQQTVSGPDGRFTCEGAPGTQATLVVRAGGVAEMQQRISEGGEVEIVLSPAALFEAITVTPTRSEQPLGDVPASVNVLDSQEIRQSPAVV